MSNLGDATATGPVTVIDELVPELSAARVASDAAVCSVAGQAVTCMAAEDLDPGETISIELETALTAPSGTPLANTASVAVAGGEIVVSNDVSSDSLVVGDLPATGAALFEFLRIGLVLVILGIGLIGLAGYLNRDNEEFFGA